MADKLGRKVTIVIAYMGAFCVSIGMFLQTSFSFQTYLLNGILGFFIGMAQAVMYIYLPELFPTHVRGSFVGICLNSGRLITIVAVLCMGVIVPLLGGYAGALCLFSLTYLVGAGTVYFAPETAAK